MLKFTSPLDHVHVAAPCSANWDEMTGDDRARHCASCQLNVYNLSAMTKREAERLLIEREGNLCVRFYRRIDGTIITQNCPKGLAAIKRRVFRTATAVLSSIISFLSGVGIYSAVSSVQLTPATQGQMVAPQSEIAIPLDRPVPQNKEREIALPPYYETTGMLANRSAELPPSTRLIKKLYSIKRVK